jgi:hypothetical protein
LRKAEIQGLLSSFFPMRAPKLALIRDPELVCFLSNAAAFQRFLDP